MDYAEMVQLLNVMDLSRQWSELQPLHDIARDELVKAAGEARQELARRAEAKVAAEAKVKAKAEADANRRADAEAAGVDRPRAIPSAAVASSHPVTRPAVDDADRRV